MVKRIEIDENLIYNNQLFEKYFNFLENENKKYNLTSIISKEEVFKRHFVNSSILGEILKKQRFSVLDIGSGAGFPGVVLKILNENIDLTMIDSVRKKVDFLKNLGDVLGLKYEVFHTRVEDFARKSEEICKYDFVTSRAVAHLSTMLEYSCQFAKIGGKIALYKGEKYLEELEESKNTLKILNLELVDVFKYEEQGSFLLIFEKKTDISKKYPRLMNKPRLKPLM